MKSMIWIFAIHKLKITRLIYTIWWIYPIPWEMIKINYQHSATFCQKQCEILHRISDWDSAHLWIKCWCHMFRPCPKSKFDIFWLIDVGKWFFFLTFRTFEQMRFSLVEHIPKHNVCWFCFFKKLFFLQIPIFEKKTNNNKQINRLVSPCDGCEAPYGYRNHMPLSTDTAEFSVRQQLQFSQSLSLSHQYHRSFSILL